MNVVYYFVQRQRIRFEIQTFLLFKGHNPIMSYFFEFINCVGVCLFLLFILRRLWTAVLFTIGIFMIIKTYFTDFFRELVNCFDTITMCSGHALFIKWL